MSAQEEARVPCRPSQCLGTSVNVQEVASASGLGECWGGCLSAKGRLHDFFFTFSSNLDQLRTN